MKQEFINQTFTDERSLFGLKNAAITDCVFEKGESPLKETSDIELTGGAFAYKYPLWYSRGIKLSGTRFETMSRAGIWYTEDIEIKGCVFDAPKCFRRAKNIHLSDIAFTDASETLWNCEDITLDHISAKGSHFGMNSAGIRMNDCSISGDYFLMGASDAEIKNLSLDGNYSFDGCKNMVISDSRLISKDCVWNCENITFKNCHIEGEYIAWNSKNITLIDCTVVSLQGFCYVENLKLINCKLKGTSLAFEYSTVEATISDGVDSIINPKSGKITVPKIGKLILDPKEVNPEDTVIEAGEITERLDRFDGVIPS